ncbi:hypothetical protein TWF281_006852 [Arthrobotrys megalospora]
MADPLSIAASIAGLIALSTGLLKLTSNVHSILKDEPAELVLNISKEIELLCGVLSHLQTWSKDRESPRPHGKKDAQEPVDFMPFINSCTDVVKKIGNQLLVLETAAKRKGIQKLFSAVTYKEKVKQLESLRNDLEKSKTTLIISLALRDRDVAKPLADISDSLSDMSDLSSTIIDVENSIGSSKEYRGPNSFEEWLESFAGPNDSEQLEAYRSKKRRQREQDEPDIASPTEYSQPVSGRVCIHVENLKSDNGSTVTESIVLDRYAPISELIRILHSKGYKQVCGFQTENGAVNYGEITSRRRPVFVTVTAGPSCYNSKKGYLINRNQRLIDYFSELVRDQESREVLNISPVLAEVKGQNFLHGLEVKSSCRYHPRLSVKLQRTLRVPDDGAVYSGTTDYGLLPLFKTSEFGGRIPESMGKKGGYFVPLFQREAIALTFKNISTNWREAESGEYFAVKVFAGSVNVVSGLPAHIDSSGRDPDYILVPEQRRLDGFQISDSTARQLIAMPSARGYSLEEQINEAEFIRGIQLTIAAPLRGAPRFRNFRTFNNISDQDLSLDLLKSPVDLGVENTQMLLDFKPNSGTQSWNIYPADFNSSQRYHELIESVRFEQNSTLAPILRRPDRRDIKFTLRHHGESLPEYRETLVNDLLWHQSKSPCPQGHESTILRPVVEISFGFQVVMLYPDGSYTTTTLQEETFHPFSDLSDFLGIVCGIGFGIAKEIGNDQCIWDIVLEINGFHVNSILEAQTPLKYTPIADITTISEGGMIKFHLYPVDKADTRYSSGYGMTTLEYWDGTLKRERAVSPPPPTRKLKRNAGASARARARKRPTPELCLGIHGVICQQIHKPVRVNIWDWNSSAFVNIQIVDAAFFQHVTGITAVSRIPLMLSDQVKLAKRITLKETTHTTQTVSFPIETVAQVDAKTATRVSLCLDQDNSAVGCACCEVNYCDTILQP